MISTKGRYALRLMIDIAAYSNGEVVSLKDISKRQNISIKYLEQVVSLLTKGGLLQSIRGNNGGYRLTKKPSDYTIGEILRTAEGTLVPVACLQCDPITCDRVEICSTIDFWKGFNEVINNYVDSVTLDKLVEKNKESAGWMYYI